MDQTSSCPLTGGRSSAWRFAVVRIMVELDRKSGGLFVKLGPTDVG
jgi:hypothetical protein